MKKISILGVDLAKASFTLCGLDDKGKVVQKKDIKADKFMNFLANLEKTTVVFEACSSSHYWARAAMRHGHTARLIAPQKVTAFRKNNKNDSNDALAICIAAQCPGMEFVAIKETHHQDLQAVLRNRERLITKQTSLVNYIRGILAEYGVSVAVGIHHIQSVLSEIAQPTPEQGESIYLDKLTPVVIDLVKEANKELLQIIDAIELMNKKIHQLTSDNPDCKRLMTIPGVGPITAATVVSTLINPKNYKNGRQYAASVGLTPKHVQTGGKDSKPIMLGISKCGNGHVRKLLVQGALSSLNSVKAKVKKSSIAAKNEGAPPEEPKASSKRARSQKGQYPSRRLEQLKKEKPSFTPKNREEWIMRLYEEKGTQVAAVALANKMARIMWAILSTQESYRPTMDDSAESRNAHAA